jgi:hypothetical protein
MTSTIRFLTFFLCCAFEIGSVAAALSKIPFFFGLPQKQLIGGQHLVHAGNTLQTAADCVNIDYYTSADRVNINYYAFPALLREAGVSLCEAGEAWVDDNWEAVTYAADDCSSSFYALSQLQTRPILQNVYKGASGELKAIAGVPNSNSAGPHLGALSHFLKEAADVTKLELNEYRDNAAFTKSLREASKSIKRLGEEQR